MNKDEWIKQLEKEGYGNIIVHTNEPHTDFGEHTHEDHAVHVILQGELILMENGNIKILREGDRFEIPRGTIHNAKCGAGGCTFIVGIERARRPTPKPKKEHPHDY